ncbi:hypothetical protein CONPUDRAFT_98979, partial [Coniophora puteana RWD-64-598 SS2]
MSTTQTMLDHIHAIRTAVTARPTHCRGTCEVPNDLLHLFYSKNAEDNQCSRINLSAASTDELAALASACQPATFGRNQENVLDETYRKAGKMDRSDFATLFHPGDIGLGPIIQNSLLCSDREFTMELYKLNVYGEGSFFKPHCDTPRSGSMFGSLVIVFPTPHEGGDLVLRHDGKESTIDFSDMFADGSQLSVGYIAFYSDVEHEVMPVKAGHRVTLTYNLYFNNLVSVVPHPTETEARLRTSISALVSDPTVLPDGGYLAFGLQHKYPLEANNYAWVVKRYLKGADEILARACTALKLDWSARIFYDDFFDLGAGDAFADEVVSHNSQLEDVYELNDISAN